MTDTVTGGCLCGAIRYEITQPVEKIVACHCADCRRAGGTAASHNSVVRAENVKIVSGTPKTFVKPAESGTMLTRFFCGDCGSPLFTQRANLREMMVLKVGTLDDPSKLEMAMNIWTRSALPWAHLDPELPAHEQNRPV